MLYEAVKPAAILRSGAYSAPPEAEQSLLCLDAIAHFDAGPAYQVRRDDYKKLLFAYTLSGSGSLTYAGQSYTLRRGSAFLIDCAAYQEYGTTGEDWQFLWAHFSGEPARQYGRYVTGLRGHAADCPGECIALWEQLFTLAQENDPRAAPRVSAAIYQLMTCFASEPPRDDRIESAVRYLQLHYRRPVAVAELAAEACMSPTYFQHRFREEVGLSPHAYLNRLRVSEAKRQLVFSRRPVEAVAADLGFSSASHFVSVFKAATGCTPRQYRQDGPVG